LIIEMVASSGGSLYELVEQLLREVGPVHYQRNDLRLSRPVSRDRMTQYLEENAPAHIAGESLAHISSLDGVKYILSDDSWLLIRPSTEPVLRVHAEGAIEMVREMTATASRRRASPGRAPDRPSAAAGQKTTATSRPPSEQADSTSSAAGGWQAVIWYHDGLRAGCLVSRAATHDARGRRHRRIGRHSQTGVPCAPG
jgi:hypothetical protein